MTLTFHLTFQPLPTLMVLTVRAVAMAAGMWHQFLMLASRAFDLHHGAGLCAALFHGRECSSAQTRVGPGSAPGSPPRRFR